MVVRTLLCCITITATITMTATTITVTITLIIVSGFEETSRACPEGGSKFSAGYPFFKTGLLLSAANAAN